MQLEGLSPSTPSLASSEATITSKTSPKKFKIASDVRCARELLVAKDNDSFLSLSLAKEELKTTITRLDARMVRFVPGTHTITLSIIIAYIYLREQAALEEKHEQLEQTCAKQQQTIEELKHTIKTKEQDLKETSMDLEKPKKRITGHVCAKQQKTIEELNADLEKLRGLVREHAEALYRAVNG
jgi:uncharacterized coiled-coil protein SlyX